MAEKRFPRDRYGEKRKSARRRTDSSEAPVFRHPLFGEIPLIHHWPVGQDGKVYGYDPDYRPTLPKGAIPGDVSKQIYCPFHHVPKYFYVDHESECIQCGNRFTFRATEQKYWYETLKFNFSSVPIRCLDCRRQRRSEHALREQIARTKALVRENDPAAYIALARAIVEYHERTNEGKLDEAVAAARKAAALWPDSAEPFLWEGIAHARARRPKKAAEALRTFLAKSVNKSLALRNKAERYLE